MPADPALACEIAFRRAGSALRWWGRVTLAAWLFDAVLGGPLLFTLPLLFVGFAFTEAFAGNLLRFEGARASLILHAVYLVLLTFYFWVMAEQMTNSVGGKRSVAVLAAILVLGVTSARATWGAFRLVPPMDDLDRPPATRRAHLHFAILIALTGGFFAVLLLVAGFSVAADLSNRLKSMVLAVVAVGAAVVAFRAVRRGHAVIGMALLFVPAFLIGTVFAFVPVALCVTSDVPVSRLLVVLPIAACIGGLVITARATTVASAPDRPADR